VYENIEKSFINYNFAQVTVHYFGVLKVFRHSGNRIWSRPHLGFSYQVARTVNTVNNVTQKTRNWMFINILICCVCFCDYSDFNSVIKWLWVTRRLALGWTLGTMHSFFSCQYFVVVDEFLIYVAGIIMMFAVFLYMSIIKYDTKNRGV
jgi:hypothetical protein